MNRCAACALAGTAFCLHLAALEAREATHLNQPEARPAIAAVVPPLRSDENPREYESAARIEDRNEAERPPAGMPPGQGNTLDVAVQVARQHFQAQWRRPPFLNFSMALDQPETPPPGRFIQTTSS